MAADILYVDPEILDDERLRRTLEEGGFHLRTAAGGQEALELARKDRPDLVITEMVLPDLSGLGLCRSLRDDETLAGIPIVMVSHQAAEMDRVVAFEMGVDDFVSKPCHPRELALRVHAILRRVSRGRGAMPADGPLRHGSLQVDPEQRRARVEDREVMLTAKEFDVLVTLMRSPGRVLSRERILDEVWGPDTRKTLRVVDTHVKWIRRKLGSAADFIETLRGVGYRFADSVDERRGDETTAGAA